MTKFPGQLLQGSLAVCGWGLFLLNSSLGQHDRIWAIVGMIWLGAVVVLANGGGVRPLEISRRSEYWYLLIRNLRCSLPLAVLFESTKVVDRMNRAEFSRNWTAAVGVLSIVLFIALSVQILLGLRARASV